MPKKSAEEKLREYQTFLPNAQSAVAKFAEHKRRLESEADFRALWETDPAATLRAVGIDPEARREMGFGEYDSRGVQCEWCITPLGNP